MTKRKPASRSNDVLPLSTAGAAKAEMPGPDRPLSDHNTAPNETGEAMREGRVKRQTALTLPANEGRFRALVTASSDVVYQMSADWKEMRQLHGRDFIADTLEPSLTWMDKYIHPDDQLRVTQAINEAIRTKSIFELEHRVLRVDGGLGWTFSRAIPLLDENGEISEWFGMAKDVTERKRAEQRLAADLDAMTRLQKLGTMFVREGNLEHVLGEIVEAAIAIAGADFGNIQLLHPSTPNPGVPGTPASETATLRIAAQRGFPQWWIDFWNSVHGGQGVCGTAMERGERVIVEDVERSPIFSSTSALEMQLRAGVRAVQSTPLVSRSGKLLGMFSTHYRKPHRPDEAALRLLDLLARQTADIIERAQAEQTLRSTEELLRFHVENTPLAVIEWGPDFRLSRWSGEAERMFGWRADEVLGHRFGEFRWVYNEDWDEVSAVAAGLLDGTRPRSVSKNRNYRKDGSIIDCEWYNSSLTDEAGKLISIFSLVLDVTQRNQAVRHLQEANRTLRAINHSNQALLCAQTEDALLQGVCRIVREDCGYAMVWIGYAEQDEAKTVRPVTHCGFEEGYLETVRITWADTERGRGPTGTAIRTGQPQLCRNMLTDPQFEPWREEALRHGYASSVAVPLTLGDACFGAITIYSREPDAFSADEVDLLRELAGNLSYGISALRTRAAHAQTDKALRESEARLTMAKEAAEIGIFDYDVVTGKIQWDARVRQLWGVGPDEPITYETFMAGVHPDDRQAVQTAIDRAMDLGGNAKYLSEYRVRNGANGAERWVLATGDAYFHSGRAVRLVGTVQDITERKRSLEILIRSEKVAALGRMAASLAHEINNPLAAVVNTLYLAQSNPDCANSVRQYLKIADEELKRVTHITRQALGFYREGNAPTRVSIRATLDETLDVFTSRIRAKQAKVEREYQGAVVEVRGISGELRQIFANLVANSLEAIDQNGTIKLRVLAMKDRGVRVTVADDGKGIEPAAMPRIFEPLFTTKGMVGTGLGLWVTKQLVDKHGGSIRLRSRATGRRRGTTFVVFLPAAALDIHSAASTRT